MKLTVYTSVFGGYDTPADLRPIPEDFRAVSVSDTAFEGWENIITKPLATDKIGLIKSNRYYKLQPWLIDTVSDFNIYVDGCIQSLNWDWIRTQCQIMTNLNLDATFVSHPREGGKTMPEIQEIGRQRKGDVSKMMHQFKKYYDEGYNDNVHIIAASLQIRRTNSEVLNNVLKTWWNEVNNGCHRDQISFGYSVWKNKFSNYTTITREERNSHVLKFGPHNKAYVI